jgi:PEGA domain-containing protein
MTRRISPLWSGIAAALLWVSAANAEPTAVDRATARSLAEEGYKALQDKHYADAADRFSRADALVHAPTLVLDWARALVGLGQLVEAQERYELILRERVDAKAPPSWQRALADAKKELERLKPRLSWVTLSVTGSPDTSVTIDGVDVPRAAIGVRRAINPGTHHVAVSAKGYRNKQQAVSLAEGEEVSVTLELEPDPEQQLAKAPVSTPPPVDAPKPVHHSRAPIYAAFAVAGAGFVVGGVSGALWLGKHSTLKAHCPDPNDCPPEDGDNVTAHRRLGTISGAGFVVGFAGAATGLTLWLLEDKSVPKQGLVVRPYLGLGTVGAVGRF